MPGYIAFPDFEYITEETEAAVNAISPPSTRPGWRWNYAICMAKAFTKTTRPEVLRLMSGPGNSWEVRYKVAGNPSTPADALEGMVDNSDYGIRLGLAGNPSSPERLLRVLYTGDWDGPAGGVRVIILGRPDCPDYLKVAHHLFR